MITSPLISVVTVCRNSYEALKSTSESIYCQNFDSFEHIIVDGASTDPTPSYLATINRDNVRWISEPDKGIYDAMNKGVTLSSGRWVIFMNAGDKFAASNTLSTISNILREVGDDTDVVYGDVIKQEHNGNMQVKAAQRPRNCHRMFFCHQSCFSRRRALIEFPFDVSHKLSADFKFFKTLILHARKFEKVDLPISVFDTNGVSNTRRSLGLADNMRVILETDGPLRGLPFILRLLPAYISAKLRGK